tara:strand:+ start:1606 stop:1818 length:213 start_codon:yes stop_codon:yes gene_type:complete
LAFAAALDAHVHVADLLATVCTRFADFGAGAAVKCVVVAVAAHEVDAGGTGRNLVEHLLDLRLLDVTAPF